MSFRIETLKAIAQSGLESYKDGVRISSLLDDKAQKTSAFAGLFLAAALGLLKPSDLQSLLLSIGWSGVLLVVGQVILLVACVGVCLSVMWLRNVIPPLTMSSQLLLTEDLFTLPDEEITEDRQTGFFYDQIEVWKTILEKQRSVNKSKARHLLVAQAILAASVFLTASMLVLLTFHAYDDIPKI